MVVKNGNRKSWLSTLRWSARVIGTLIVLTSVIFIIADLVEHHKDLTGFFSSPHKGVMILTDVFFLLSCIGLIIALWREGLGGLIAFIGMLGVIILILNNPDFNASWMLIIFLLPSLLYLLYWWLSIKSNQRNNTI